MAGEVPQEQSLPGMNAELSLEKALDTYLRPTEKGDTSRRLYREKSAQRIGRRLFASVRPTSITPLPQIRGSYERAHIEGLASSFIAEGQQQDSCVNVLTTKQKLNTYLGEVSEHHGQEIDVEVIRHRALGGYVVDAYGHNRHFAAAAAATRLYGHPDRGEPLHVKVLKDQPFERVLGLQAIENNISNSPHAWDTAFSMGSYARLMEAKGQPVSNEEIGKLFGMTAKNAWKLMTFASLPRWVQDYAIEDKLEAHGLYHVHRIINLYSEADLKNMLDGLAQRKASTKNVEKAVKTRATIAELPAELRSIVDSGDLANEYARLLVDMLQAGYDIEQIHARAMEYLSPQKPSISEATKRHQIAMDDFIAYGGRDAFGVLGQVNAEYADSYVPSSVNGTDVKTVDLRDSNLRAQTKLLTDDIDTLISSLTSGLAGEAMAGSPIADTIAGNGLYAMLDRLDQLMKLENSETADSQRKVVENLRLTLEEAKRTRNRETSLFAT